MADFARALLAGLQAGGNSYVAELERRKEEQRQAEAEAARIALEDDRYNKRFDMQTNAQVASEDRQAARQDARETTQYQREDERLAKRDAAENSQWDRRFAMEQAAANGRLRLQASLSAGSRAPSETEKATERRALGEANGLTGDALTTFALGGGVGRASATSESGKVAERQAIAQAQGLNDADAKRYALTGQLAKADDAGQVDPRRIKMAEQARGFAAQITGKSPDEVAKMSNEEVRDLVANNSKFMSGPVLGRILPSITNPGADAYSQSAAGIQARLNNPTGPVSNADFEVARRSGFTPEKPADVNADLVYDALRGGQGATAPQQQPVSQPTNAPQQPAPNPTDQTFRQRATNAQGEVVEYDPQRGWVKVQ